MVKQRIPSANQKLGCGILWNNTSTLAFLLIWISYFTFHSFNCFYRLFLHLRTFMLCYSSLFWFFLKFFTIIISIMAFYDCTFRSFYVGDAAGRKNDHSDADIKFAEVLIFSSLFLCSSFFFFLLLHFFFFFNNFKKICCSPLWYIIEIWVSVLWPTSFPSKAFSITIVCFCQIRNGTLKSRCLKFWSCDIYINLYI